MVSIEKEVNIEIVIVIAGEEKIVVRRNQRRESAVQEGRHKNRLVENPRARVHRSLDADYWSRPPREQEGFSRHK